MLPVKKLGSVDERSALNKKIIAGYSCDQLDSKREKRYYKSIVIVISILSLAVLFAGCGNDDTNLAVEPKDEEMEEVGVKIDADYYLDYDSGTIALGELPVGTRIADPSWQWTYRTGVDYTFESSHVTKPVTWIIVAKDHYEGIEPHVTLLAEELIGRFAFDNSTDRDHEFGDYGYNHWGDSGSANANRGIRPWLNSDGIHIRGGFYLAFSANFKEIVIATILDNKEWPEGLAYTTEDSVFIPSTTELGDTSHTRTYEIGDVYSYFLGAGSEKRIASLGRSNMGYWTRSPDSEHGSHISIINYGGDFPHRSYHAKDNHYGVRPVVNVKSSAMVSEAKD